MEKKESGPVIVSAMSLQEKEETAGKKQDHAYSKSDQVGQTTDSLTEAGADIVVPKSTPGPKVPVKILPATTQHVTNVVGTPSQIRLPLQLPPNVRLIQMPSQAAMPFIQNVQRPGSNQQAFQIRLPPNFILPTTGTPTRFIAPAVSSAGTPKIITSAPITVQQTPVATPLATTKRHASVQVQLNSKHSIQSLKMQLDSTQQQLTKYIKDIHIKYQQIAKMKQLTAQMNKKLGKIGVMQKKPNKQKVLEYGKEFMSGTALELFKMQVRMSKRSHYGRRWTREDIKFASDLFTENQDAYTYFVSVFALPAMRSLFTHDMDFLDDEIGNLEGGGNHDEEEDGPRDESDNEEERQAIEGLIDMDLETCISEMEIEARQSDVQIPDIPELDAETVLSVKNKGLKDIMLTSKNTFVIDLTKIAEEHRQKPDKEPKKVIVYMSIPKKT